MPVYVQFIEKRIGEDLQSHTERAFGYMPVIRETAWCASTHSDDSSSINDSYQFTIARKLAWLNFNVRACCLLYPQLDISTCLSLEMTLSGSIYPCKRASCGKSNSTVRSTCQNPSLDGRAVIILYGKTLRGSKAYFPTLPTKFVVSDPLSQKHSHCFDFNAIYLSHSPRASAYGCIWEQVPSICCSMSGKLVQETCATLCHPCKRS